jgi:tetratricopeptide (TPR) repeat protein
MKKSIVFVAGVLVASCGASRQSAYLTTGGEAAKEEKAKEAGKEAPKADLEQEAEAHWEKRGSVGDLWKAMHLYKQIVKTNPSRKAFARLARGYYLLGYGYLKKKEEVLAAYDEGAKWGERIMGLSPKFSKKIAAGEKDYKALSVAKKEDVPGIYWAYVNLGKWSVLQGFTTVLANKSKLKAFIDKVTELDDKYYYAAGDRGLGAYYAKAPSFAGGDLEKSEKHFKKCLSIAPNYLGTKVAMAEFYAVKKQDKKLFKKLLDEVIAADVNVIPEIVPIQTIEKRKAKELLAKMDDLFE